MVAQRLEIERDIPRLGTYRYSLSCSGPLCIEVRGDTVATGPAISCQRAVSASGITGMYSIIW